MDKLPVFDTGEEFAKTLNSVDDWGIMSRHVPRART